MNDDERPEGQVERFLDQLGREAAAESPPPTAMHRSTKLRSRPKLLAGAAVVVLVVAGAALTTLAIGQDGGDEVVTAASTTAPPDSKDGLPQWSTDNLVTMRFEPDAASATAVLEVTIHNMSDVPWSFECRTGVLSRWDGETSETIGSVIWRDDRLYVSTEVVEPGCTTPTAVLQPDATEVRTIRLGSTVDSDGNTLTLQPGAYQLLFADQETFTGAVGQFIVTDD